MRKALLLIATVAVAGLLAAVAWFGQRRDERAGGAPVPAGRGAGQRSSAERRPAPPLPGVAPAPSLPGAAPAPSASGAEGAPAGEAPEASALAGQPAISDVAADRRASLGATLANLDEKIADLSARIDGDSLAPSAKTALREQRGRLVAKREGLARKLETLEPRADK